MSPWFVLVGNDLDLSGLINGKKNYASDVHRCLIVSVDYLIDTFIIKQLLDTYPMHSTTQHHDIKDHRLRFSRICSKHSCNVTV